MSEIRSAYFESYLIKYKEVLSLSLGELQGGISLFSLDEMVHQLENGPNPRGPAFFENEAKIKAVCEACDLRYDAILNG